MGEGQELGVVEDGDSGLRKVGLPWDLFQTHLGGPVLSHPILSNHVNSEGSVRIVLV